MNDKEKSRTGLRNQLGVVVCSGCCGCGCRFKCWGHCALFVVVDFYVGLCEILGSVERERTIRYGRCERERMEDDKPRIVTKTNQLYSGDKEGDKTDICFSGERGGYVVKR